MHKLSSPGKIKFNLTLAGNSYDVKCISEIAGKNSGKIVLSSTSTNDSIKSDCWKEIMRKRAWMLENRLGSCSEMMLLLWQLFCVTKVAPFLNPRTAGGGGYPPPPSGFSQIAKKTAARSAAKFAIAIQPTIWHIFKKTMTRWHQRSRLQVTLGDLTSSCVFRSLTSCQRHTSDPNSLKLAVYSKGVGVYNLYISDFLYRWP